MTDDQEYTEPIIPPLESDPDLKEYRCPHCGKLLFKGDVKRLQMVCHHCQKMVDADNSEFFRSIVSDE